MQTRSLLRRILTIAGFMLIVGGWRAVIGAPDVAALQAALALPLCSEARLSQDVWEVSAGDAVTAGWQSAPARAVSAQVVVYQVGLPDWGTIQFMLRPYRGYATGDDALFGALTGADFYLSPDGLSRSFLSGNPGVYNLLTVFYDAAGKPDCRTRHSWLLVGARVVRYVDPCGVVRIVVFSGSSYTGGFDLLVTGGSYTGDDACEIIHGNDTDNFIDGGGGNDVIYGYDGADIIYGGTGNDSIDAGDGDDDVFGGSENNPGEFVDDGGDVIEGGAGSDTIYGGNDNAGGGGNDGSDVITDSGGDNDHLVGGNLNDGGVGNDSNDTLSDAAGSGDTLIGGNENDNGSAGNDGNDRITDSAGTSDTLIGGNQNTNSSTGNDGSDTLTDSGGANDQIYGGNASTIGSSGNDNADGGGDTMTSVDGAGGDTIVGGNNNVATGSDGSSDSANCELVLGDSCSASVP